MTDREMLKRAYLFLFYCLLFGILPLSGTANNNVSGSFYNLLNQYNATSGTTGATKIVQLPLAFVRSDAVNLRDGKIWYLGQYGAYWSRTAQSSNYAYYLVMNPTDVGPSNYSNRYLGFPLRWLYQAKA